MARFFLALCGLLLLAVFKWLFDHFLYDWFVQNIESVFGLKEADFEGTAARTPRARGKTKWPGLAEHVEVRADFGLKSSTQSTIVALAVAGSATI